jgi:hypothetical protein
MSVLIPHSFDTHSRAWRPTSNSTLLEGQRLKAGFDRVGAAPSTHAVKEMVHLVPVERGKCLIPGPVDSWGR